MTSALGTESVRRAVEDRYLLATPGSATALQDARRVLPGGDTRQQAFVAPHPPVLVEGSGARVRDVDGNVLVDLTNGWSALVLGHAHPTVSAAIARQAERGTLFSFTHPGVERHARSLVERFASIDLVRYANSGTEANVLAAMAARRATGRSCLVLVEGGYHSSYDVADLGPRGPSIRVPFNDVAALEAAFAERGPDVAAVLVEPMLGPGGMVPPAPGYLASVREVTAAAGSLLILDEVITARMAIGGGQQAYEVVPDLTTLGKYIGGGLPLAAVGGRSQVMELFAPDRADRLRHSGTFTANPLALAAGEAAMALITQPLLDELNSAGDALREGLAAAARDQGVAVDCSGWGSLLNLHVPRPSGGDDVELLRLIYLALYVRGVLVAPRGFACLSAPMTPDDLEAVREAFADALSDLRPVLPPRR